MKILAVIPARYNSTRFPGKPLALIDGIPMIVRTYRQVKECKKLDGVVILTDDQRIYDAAHLFNCNVMLTPETCKNGTERLLKVYKGFKNIDAFINIQGDEPLIRISQIEQVINGLEKNHQVVTLIKEVADNIEFNDPNIVKVAIGPNKKALYFSRSPIPFHQTSTIRQDYIRKFHKHIGIYGFTKETLDIINKIEWNPKSLSNIENLEQLQWLENGIDIFVEETPYNTIGVDTPEDLKRLNNTYSQ